MTGGVIAAIGHLAIQTTRFDESIQCATDILGLHVTHRTDDAAFLSASPVHHELVYRRSEHEGIDHIGLVAANVSALEETRARVDRAGYTVVSEQPLEAGITKGFAFEGPEGFVYEVYVGMAEATVPYGGFGPNRFGHINIHPLRVEEYRSFLQEILDFRISDVVGDDFAYFLRCNPDHHGIALISGRGSLHHHAWETQSIADLGRLGDRLDDIGRRLIWGPVRHGAGHNIAAYFVEPAGGVIELYTDLEQIYDDERPPVRWSSDDSRWFNRWGIYNGEEFRSHGLFPAPTIVQHDREASQ